VLGFNRKKWDADGSVSPDSGYNNINWKDLPKEVKKAAHTLGYTESMWDNDGDSPLDEKSWNELTKEQRKAAKLIGYDQRHWDDESDAFHYYDHLDWADLPVEVKTAAKCLKYSQSIWDNNGKSPLSDKVWEELTQNQKQAANVLGKFLDKLHRPSPLSEPRLPHEPVFQLSVFQVMTRRNGITIQMAAIVQMRALQKFMNQLLTKKSICHAM
jgi:hypothetical protein